MGRKSRIARGLDIGAELADEEYFALERQALKRPIERDLEEFEEIMLNEPEAPLSPELEEIEKVEVVRPEIMARWRAWGVPEPTIEDIIRQRVMVIEARKVEKWITIPDYAYTMPEVPEIEAEKWGFAKIVDAEGSILPHVWLGADKIAKIDRTIYRYEYLRPMVRVTVYSYPFLKEIANMMLTFVMVERARRPETREYVIRYRAEASSARAVRICYLIEPDLSVPEKRLLAKRVLQNYKRRPLIPTSSV